MMMMMMMIAVRRAQGGPEARVRHSGVDVLKVAGVEALMVLLQEAVVGDRRHPAVGGVPIDVRHALLVSVGDLTDRPIRGGTSGREGRRRRRRHHGRRMVLPVEGREAERVGQSHGTVSRRLTLAENVRDVSRFLVVVAIIIVARLPLIILSGLAFNLDAGLRGLGHLDLDPHVVPVGDGLALDREAGRRSRRRTRRAGALVAATHAGLLHPRGIHASMPRWRSSASHDSVIVLRVDGTVVDYGYCRR